MKDSRASDCDANAVQTLLNEAPTRNGKATTLEQGGGNKMARILTDLELFELINLCAKFYVTKLRYTYNYEVEYDEVLSRLSLIGVESSKKYRGSEKHTANEKTYIKTAFKNRMQNYRERELFPERERQKDRVYIIREDEEMENNRRGLE